MIIVQITSVNSITGKPFFAHLRGVIARSGFPVVFASFSETVTMYTLAVEPMCVPLPPIPTPIARHQHQAAIFTPTDSKEAMIGIMAAVNGILSMAADITAATHIKAMQVNIKFSCITSPLTGSTMKGTIY